MDEPQDLKFQFTAGLKKVKCLKHKTPADEFLGMPRLRRSLLIAYQIQEQLDSGRAPNLKKIAEWLHLTTARVTQIMNLLFLAPEIQEEILFSESENLQRLPEQRIRPVNKELSWNIQKEIYNNLPD